MYSIRKLVYYCDFGCKKHLLSPMGMEVHEEHCTLNPNRKCRMPMCRTFFGPCPWCQFAKARQNKWEGWDYTRDIKAEVKEWRAHYHHSVDIAG